MAEPGCLCDRTDTRLRCCREFVVHREGSHRRIRTEAMWLTIVHDSSDARVSAGAVGVFGAGSSGSTKYGFQIQVFVPIALARASTMRSR